MSHGLFLNEKVKKIIAEIAEVAGYLWDRGWAERNAGNISVNITDLLSSTSYHFDESAVHTLDAGFLSLRKNTFLITATGIRMRDLAKSPENGLCLLTITGNGKGYQIAELGSSSHQKQKAAPTSELPTHLVIQEMLARTKPEQRALLHAHVPEFIALTQIREFNSQEPLNRMLLNMHPETKMFVPRGIGFVPYLISGSETLAAATVSALEDHDVAVWEKHGLLAVGNSVSEAFDTMDLMTQAAKIFFLCKNAGYAPEGLTHQQPGGSYGEDESVSGTSGKVPFSGRRRYYRRGLRG